MIPEHHLTFGPFRLETTQGRLWRGDQGIPLRPRSLAMLGYLVAHAGRLVTKAEVLQHVWGGSHVSDSVLRVSVQEIRAALGDAAGAPRYLETVGRQGYRFLMGSDLEGPPPLVAGPLVGRQGDVAALERWYQQAVHGTRQLVFISGEAGVGKTTVVEMFLSRLGETRTQAWPTNERLLVCVGPSPTSAKVIRTAKRMAAAMHAQWIAVHVETPRRPGNGGSGASPTGPAHAASRAARG